MPQKPNRLIHQTSPYLKQHAYNPVDWYPWGEEAIEKAKQEKKPILLSIGYAACHWCHVMAHESFEDEHTAQLMNQLFVNIKVDKEERPDLDKIYQTTHYLLTQHAGGWPLTVFLTPDTLTPFYSGTYFPKEEHYQLPAFTEVLKVIHNLYQQKSTEIVKQNQELQKILQQKLSTNVTVRLNSHPYEIAMESLQHGYDRIHGGFGSAPKFPQAPKLELLIQMRSNLASDQLIHMAKGGIYDQLAGGFFRYSVDDHWEIPHFEKMLYDNGQLLYLYARASQIYREPIFKHIARETGQWVLNEMHAPQAGFYSSIDADSEGHEGKFYIWDKHDVESLLTAEEYAVIQHYFCLDKPANFDHQWHFHINKSIEDVATRLKMSNLNARELLLSAKHKLLNIRNKRIHPAIDHKILTSWNGLMIKGLMFSGFVLENSVFIESAKQAINFIKQNLWKNNRLLASYSDQQASLSAYLDDYVFLMDALLTALEIEWNKEYLLFAIELADTLINNFYDENAGGFYFTAKDHEKLLYRPKTMLDEAVPSGNGIAVQVLLRLGHLLGETRYINAAEKTLLAAWPHLEKYPAEHCTLLQGLNEFLNPSEIIIIRGEKQDLRKSQRNFQNLNNYVLAIPNDESNLPGLLAEKKPMSKTCAYVCKGRECSAQFE